jgi:ATPase subunit of ABC transporter with duplicated ATPase domains
VVSLLLDSVTKAHGARAVLTRVRLSVDGGSRIGVVGPNGVGKTTLLRLLAGLEPPDSGTVRCTPSGLRVGYLPQELDAHDGETLLAYLARRTGIAAAEEELEALAARLGDEPELATAYTDFLDRFLQLGGHDLAARAASVCAELGLPHLLERPVVALSGGQAARARLAAVLLSRFDVFCLDEPTNDLDFSGLDRLERFVTGVRAGIVLVSHDRAFLDRTVSRIVELEEGTGQVREWPGGWSEYEAARDRERTTAYRRFAETQERRRELETLLNQRRGQARSGTTLAKRTGGSDRRGTRALMTKVRQAERALERLEQVEKPFEPWELQFAFTLHDRSGDLVLRLERAVVERGGFTLGPIDVELRWGDRAAVLGTNGSGKSTLLGALLGALPLASGKRIVGAGVVVGELDQRRAWLDRHGSLLSLFTADVVVRTEDARTLLAKFGLGADDVLRDLRTLSPGERTRAALAALVARGANCLVLDEPTNHLDLPAIEQLEVALEAYMGTVVLVTHDRRLLERFQPTQQIELDA